jgi:hypothetical protein
MSITDAMGEQVRPKPPLQMRFPRPYKKG